MGPGRDREKFGVRVETRIAQPKVALRFRGADGGYVNLEEGVDEMQRLREIAMATMGKGVKRVARQLAQENGKEFQGGKWGHSWAGVTKRVINKEFQSDSAVAAQPRPA